MFVHAPGTYTFHKTPGLALECYLESDLSHAIERLDTLDLRLLPSALRAGFREARIDPRGETFVSREPFFVLVRPLGTKTGEATVWLTEHQGESDVTAIALQLHRSVLSSFPVGQRLGDHDLCWFRAVMPPTYAGTPRTERFIVRNPTGGTVTTSLLDAAQQPIAAAASSPAARVETSADFMGGEPVFLVLKRGSDQLAGFDVTWVSPVCFIDLADPFYLYVMDETGVDALGAGEPDRKLRTVSLPVPDVVSDGLYTFTCTITRFP
ncbi:MAG: hypothetical protein R3E83_22100 [Burkholderiaceae bacterium]